MSSPSSFSADHAVTLRVTVVSLPDAQRVLTVLTGRAYTVTRFEAEESTAGCWRLTIDLFLPADAVDLVRARLERLPGALAVAAR
jgi:hypothetical protein